MGCHFSNIAKNISDANTGHFNKSYMPSEEFKKFISQNVPKNSKFFIPEITTKSVITILNTMQNKKSTGMDNISTEYIKLAGPVLASHICTIINQSIREGVYPSQWKISKIIPLFKHGNRSDPNNYRPIAILSCVSKLLEKHVHNALYKYLQNNKLLSSSQSGFRAQHSTQTVLTKILNNWTEIINEGKLVGCVTIDLTKAFDLLNFNILLAKMKLYDFSEHTLLWFNSYLNGRSQKVLINDEISENNNVSFGVPQGSVLGPLLFSLFINDLPLYVINCIIEMYADDTTLYLYDLTIGGLETKLRSDLFNVENWCKMNHLVVNTSKTQSMLICSKQKRLLLKNPVLNLKFCNSSIECVSSLKLLGLLIDNELTWKQHVDKVLKTVSCLVGVLFRIRPFVTTNVLILFYNACILPHFDYCINIWGNTCELYTRKLFIIQKRAARIIMNKSWDTPNKPLFMKLGWLTFYQRYQYLSSVFLFKILNGMSPSYLSCFKYSNARDGIRSTTDKKLYIPKPRCELFKKSFVYSSILIRNSLPTDLRTSRPLNIFKKELHLFLLSQSDLV